MTAGATATELAGETGLTYRQLDHWSRCGYLRPLNNGGGSGSRRRYTEREQRIARLMARLVDAGLAVPIAAEIARDAERSDLGTYATRLGEGVYLSIVVEI